jgi:hypothetical protein
LERVIRRAVLASVGRKLERFPAPGKMNIHSCNVDDVNHLGEALEYGVYHWTVDSQDGKARRLKNWMMD